MNELTAYISAAVALAAIISPIIVTCINNAHQLKLKQLELSHETEILNITHVNTIIENYIKHAGRCIASKGTESYTDYAESFFLVLPFVTIHPQLDIRIMDEAIRTGQWETAYEAFEKFTASLAGKL